jgi:hypothetical protein
VRTDSLPLADAECNSANNTDTNGDCLIYAYCYTNGDSYSYRDCLTNAHRQTQRNTAATSHACAAADARLGKKKYYILRNRMTYRVNL